MKITFTFTDSPDIQSTPKNGIYTTNFEIPDEARHLIGYEERILAAAQMVGQLTQAALHISCKELGYKNHPVKPTHERTGSSSVWHSINAAFLCFERFGYRTQYCQLKILLPKMPGFPRPYVMRHGRNKSQRHSLTRNLLQIHDSWCKTEEDFQYISSVRRLSEQIPVLLNAQPNAYGKQSWEFLGYHPYWVDNVLINLQNKRIKAHEVSERKRKREAEKLEAQRVKAEEKLKAQQARAAEKGQTATAIPVTGAGRRSGAIPGVFKGVQFRSQLEIRFATALEEQRVRWFYETERLGEGNYLVDFYLPDYKVWVEVKGKFEPRDNYLLRDVAGFLKKERGERLFVFTQGKCFVVNPSGFREISRDEFWKKLLSNEK